MNPQEKQHFEDLLIKAIQSGKRETSDLVDMVIHKIEPAVEKAVEKYVNGKLDNYIRDDMAWKSLDADWKARAEPVIKMGENVAGFSKVSLYIVGFVASVAGAILVIINLIKKQ